MGQQKERNTMPLVAPTRVTMQQSADWQDNQNATACDRVRLDAMDWQPPANRLPTWHYIRTLRAFSIPMKIRKAVFPVAGLGTRVLPATKAMPKEMLTIVDKPLIQYVVDEAREAGIEHFVFVTGRNKGVIEDHFDRMFELDTTLAARGKKAEQEILAASQPEAGAMSFTRQQAPLGLGHAVWCARDIVGNEPFAVVLPDELVLNTPGCLKQMVEHAGKLDAKANLIAVEAVPEHLTHQYGICGVGMRTGKLF
jgi:UTP--glucose-1-phosphate uridylyltransferase